MTAPRRLLERDIVTRVTTVLFVVSTVTGVMLLLHWQGGLVRASHEWLSLAFAAFAGWHLVKNRHAFAPYLRRHVALTALALSLAFSVAFTAMTATTTGSGGSPREVIQALSGATVEAAAPIFGLSPAAAIERLAGSGFVAATPTDTLAAIGKAAGKPAMEVVAVLAATTH